MHGFRTDWGSCAVPSAAVLPCACGCCENTQLSNQGFVSAPVHTSCEGCLLRPWNSPYENLNEGKGWCRGGTSGTLNVHRKGKIQIFMHAAWSGRKPLWVFGGTHGNGGRGGLMGWCRQDAKHLHIGANSIPRCTKSKLPQNCIKPSQRCQLQSARIPSPILFFF